VSVLNTPACELLGCRYPLVLAGMGGVSRSQLVGAVSAAGGFGFLGMVREPPALIATEVEALRRQGHFRFGVNLIPAATAPALLEAELSTCIALEVPGMTLFWDIDRAIVGRVRDAGITAVYQVGSVEEGRAAAAAGAQILIAQGVEAGGHVRGSTPLLELLPALVQAVKLPVLAAGGIVTGTDVAAALALGAQGAVLGAAMIATDESFAHDLHKAKLLTAGRAATILTEAFHINWPGGAKVRVLDGPVAAGLRGDPAGPGRTVIGSDDGRPIYLFSTDSPLRTTTGELDAMALYAGMGAERIEGVVPAGERIRMLLEDVEGQLRLPAQGGAGVELASAVCYAGINPDYMGYLGHEALLDRLGGLQRTARGALRRVPRGSSAQRDFARWALLLGCLIEELGGPVVPPDAAAGESDAATLFAEARALLPVVFEERVRQVLSLLLDEAAPAPPG
jgi:nitronate monooxygenase